MEIALTGLDIFKICFVVLIALYCGMYSASCLIAESRLGVHAHNQRLIYFVQGVIASLLQIAFLVQVGVWIGKAYAG